MKDTEVHRLPGSPMTLLEMIKDVVTENIKVALVAVAVEVSRKVDIEIGVGARMIMKGKE